MFSGFTFRKSKHKYFSWKYFSLTSTKSAHSIKICLTVIIVLHKTQTEGSSSSSFSKERNVSNKTDKAGKVFYTESTHAHSLLHTITYKHVQTGKYGGNDMTVTHPVGESRLSRYERRCQSGLPTLRPAWTLFDLYHHEVSERESTAVWQAGLK